MSIRKLVAVAANAGPVVSLAAGCGGGNAADGGSGELVFAVCVPRCRNPP